MRVFSRKNDKTSEVDRQRFLGSAQQAIAIETLWYEKAITTILYLYEMPSSTFSLFDSIAGYYVSHSLVLPTSKYTVNAPIKQLLSNNTELLILPSLWQLHDAVVNSTLEFSIIRMKNAQPRPFSR